MPLPKAYGIQAGWVTAPGQSGGSAPPPAPVVYTGPFVAWGDDQTNGNGSNGTNSLGYTVHLASLTGRTVQEEGVPGQTSSFIVARQSGTAFNVTITSGTIPAGTTAEPATVNMNVIAAAESIRGMVSGVLGTLARISGASYTFTRDTAGSAVASAGAQPFTPEKAVLYRNYTQLLWAGRNDTPKSDLETAPGLAKAKLAAAVAYIPHTRYLVFGITLGQDEGSGGAKVTDRNAILAFNSNMKTLYGARFFDINAFMADKGPNGALAYAKIYAPALTYPVVGGSADDIAMSDQLPPPSLASSNLNFTAAGYYAIAKRVAEIAAPLEAA